MKRILGCVAAQVNEVDSGWKKRAFAVLQLPFVRQRARFRMDLTRADTLRVSSLLALVQMPVCRFQQFWRGASVFRIYAYADADGQWRPLVPLAECPPHALRNAICHSGVGVDQYHCEL